MNDLLYYEPIATVLEGDATYQDSSTQVRFGYLTLAASFHWNLLKLLGDRSPKYVLAPPTADVASHLQLPYLNESLALHVIADGVSSDDWLEHATVELLAQVHADCLASLLCVESADVASSLLSNVGHTVVIRVVRRALQLARRKTVDLAVLEEAIATLCLLSQRRYEGRIPELAVCFGHSHRRRALQGPAIHFGRTFLDSKKSAVLLKGGSLLLQCLGNGRVIEVVDLDFVSSGQASNRILAPLSQRSVLNHSIDHAAVTLMLTRQGEVLLAMGARICFSWDAAGWHLYPGKRLADQLLTQLSGLCNAKSKSLPRHLAQHLTTIGLTLRDDRLGALLVVSSSEEMVKRLIQNRQENVGPVEALYSGLFVGRPFCKLSPQLVCNAAALDGAVVLDRSGIVRGIGCIFETRKAKTSAEGARTRAAMFASRDGIALKISQDGEMSVFSNGKNQLTVFSPVW